MDYLSIKKRFTINNILVELNLFGIAHLLEVNPINRKFTGFKIQLNMCVFFNLAGCHHSRKQWLLLCVVPQLRSGTQHEGWQGY